MVLAGSPRSMRDYDSSTPRHRHAQVRPWTDAVSTYRLALARCGGRPGPVHNSPPVVAQQSAAVPGRPLPRILKHCRSSATTLSTALPAGRTIVTKAAHLTIRNSLSDALRDPSCTDETFSQSPKTVLFMLYDVSVCPAH